MAGKRKVLHNKLWKGRSWLIRVRFSVSTVSYVGRKINELKEKVGLQSMPLVYSSRRSVDDHWMLRRLRGVAYMNNWIWLPRAIWSHPMCLKRWWLERPLWCQGQKSMTSSPGCGFLSFPSVDINLDDHAVGVISSLLVHIFVSTTLSWEWLSIHGLLQIMVLSDW